MRSFALLIATVLGFGAAAGKGETLSNLAAAWPATTSRRPPVPEDLATARYERVSGQLVKHRTHFSIGSTRMAAEGGRRVLRLDAGGKDAIAKGKWLLEPNEIRAAFGL
jgi:hypothetical protein